MVELNKIQTTVKKIDGKLVLEISNGAAEVLGLEEGSTVKFFPEKVNSGNRIYEIKEPKINIPIIDPRNVKGFSNNPSPSNASYIKELFLKKLSKYEIRKIKGKTSVYDIGSRCRIYIKYSKYLNSAAPFFFGLDPDVITDFSEDINKSFFIVFLAENENNAYIFPWKIFKEWLKGVSPAVQDGNWKISYTSDRKLRLTEKDPIDVSKYLNNFELFECNKVQNPQNQ